MRGKIKSRTLIVNGVSKTYAMDRLAIGYAAGRGKSCAINKIQSHSTSNPTSIRSAKRVAAWRTPGYCQQMRLEFERRRLPRGAIGRSAGRSEPSCRGRGFFIYFPNFSAYYQKKNWWEIH